MGCYLPFHLRRTQFFHELLILRLSDTSWRGPLCVVGVWPYGLCEEQAAQAGKAMQNWKLPGSLHPTKALPRMCFLSFWERTWLCQQADLELLILLPPPPKKQDYRHSPQGPGGFYFETTSDMPGWPWVWSWGHPWAPYPPLLSVM